MHALERIAPDAPDGLCRDAARKSIFQVGADGERVGGKKKPDVRIGFHLLLHGGEKGSIGTFGYGTQAVGTADMHAHYPVAERTANIVDALL